MKTELIPTLESETLLLRPWIPEYAGDFYRINNDPETTSAAGVKAIPTLKDAQAKLKAFEKSKRMEWSIALKEKDAAVIVGGIGICEVISVKEYHNVKELGYGVAKEYRGRGIMPLAVLLVEEYCKKAFGSEATIIRFAESNTPSRRVAEKCGYVYHSKTKIGTMYKMTYIKPLGENSEISACADVK